MLVIRRACLQTKANRYDACKGSAGEGRVNARRVDLALSLLFGISNYWPAHVHTSEGQMRSADGDYTMIEATLKTYQRDAVRDLAVAVGLTADRWWEHTNCRVLAKDLAVANIVRRLTSGGRTRRQALNEAAALLNLDAESLQRRYREHKRRNSMAQLTGD